MKDKTELTRRTGRQVQRRGFSLIELMAVVVILGLLVTTVAVVVSGQLGKGKSAIARTRADIIVQGIEQFAITEGRIPTQDEGLQILVQPQPGQPQPYLKPAQIKDPWGNPYIYIVPGQVGPYEVISYGRDGQPGGEGEDADISTDDQYDEQEQY